ncbi:MAG: hypothetical protein E7157_02200 [Lactobacillales bacterium]|nr:hypothetical protein [Lactobacillales bacterium]
MKAENVYRGDILICSKYPDRYAAKQQEPKIDVVKENAILIKVGEQYVDLDVINSDLDLLKANRHGYKTYYTCEGDTFVGNLKRYYYNKNEKVNVKQLKKER